MNGGPTVIRTPTVEKSNAELTAALRTNFLAAQEAVEEIRPASNDGPTSCSTASRRPPLLAWTDRRDNVLYVPSVDWSLSGVAEERSQYDITVKLFYLPGVPPSRRHAHMREAISLVLRELKVSSIDLLIVSFPGVAFDAECEDGKVKSVGSGGYESAMTANGKVDGEVEDIQTMVKTWRTLETMHGEGLIGQLGVAEFGSQRLKEFLQHTHARPSVDQINVRDCCVVPRPLITFAKREGIELLTHNDCTNILPRGTLRELLGSGEKGAGVLVTDDDPAEDGLRGEVEPQWVVKYTAVVKDRGVVENKGYFAMALLVKEQRENGVP
ncbi:MAG: hypothetical protein M1832_003911 [Thelocarpon impressellum]|nr:MAG: hypothetical protein M1832_003911 [Thelocarpon impressellum]